MLGIRMLSSYTEREGANSGSALVFLQLFGLKGTFSTLFVYVIFILKLIVGLF